MIIPPSVVIMGRKIYIQEVDKTFLQKEFGDEKEILAFYQEETDMIYLLSTLKPVVKRRVLLHELTHVLFSVSGLKHTLKQGQEEQLCDMNESLLSLFTDEEFTKFMVSVQDVA